MDDFARGFIEAMLFTECSPAYDSEDWFDEECQKAIESGRSDGNLPGDVDIAMIHPDSLAAIVALCGRWKSENAKLLNRAVDRDSYNWERAGHDLWFTSQGHGVGFWDRAELEHGGLGEALSDAASYKFCIDPFFGNHVEYGDAPFVHVDIQ